MGTSAKSAPGAFEKAREQAAGQAEQTAPQVVSRQFAGSPSTIQPVSTITPSAPEMLSTKLSDTGHSLSILIGRMSATPQVKAPSPLQLRLQQIEAQFRQTGMNMQQASSQTDPMQFLKLQNDIYQIAEELELLSKVVEQTTSGIKTVLQIQV